MASESSTPHVIGCSCLECALEGWRMEDSSKTFRDAASEIDTLRFLVDRQLQAIDNTPADDMNHAGEIWQRRCAESKRPS